MSKYLKYKTSKKPTTISALQHHLFDKLGQIENDSYASRDFSDPLFSEFAEHGYANTNQLLHKAKNIVHLGVFQTYNNRGKLERIKREIKKCQEEEKGAFVTGVGLYLQEKETPTEENLEVDEDSLMRNLAHNEFDDLAQLRRMIKKTESNLRNYSQSVHRNEYRSTISRTKLQTQRIKQAEKSTWGWLSKSIDAILRRLSTISRSPSRKRQASYQRNELSLPRTREGGRFDYHFSSLTHNIQKHERMKVKINSWNAVATWKWNIETQECCTICQFAFESPCPRCKVPGDDCVPIQGQCLHHFHLHCILKWTEQGSSENCPLCREKWVVKN